QMPTAPIVDRAPSGAMSTSPTGEAPAPAPTPDPPPASGAVSSRTLSPLLGGTVSAGQFKVIVPPGALRKTAPITVCQPRLDVRQVELTISPPSANGFLLPVLLVADCKDMSLEVLKLQTMWWWNPQTQHWEAVLNVQVDLLGRTVTAPLWHFST